MVAAPALPEASHLAAPRGGRREPWPVLPPLAALLPGGTLRPGGVVAVAGATSLALALLAGAATAGAWCGVVGVPSVGLVAAAEHGVDLDRLVLVGQPGDAWATVLATLVDALDVVLVRPGGRHPASDVRRLAARVREREAVVVALGDWDGADVRLTVVRSRWEGLGPGHGHLRARRVEVQATGRGAAARPRSAVLWLPGPTGRVEAAGSVTQPALVAVPGPAVATAARA